ncbi:MAG: SRPBCC family protein [Candidatus Sumerlaeaceae bacterium]
MESSRDISSRETESGRGMDHDVATSNASPAPQGELNVRTSYSQAHGEDAGGHGHHKKNVGRLERLASVAGGAIFAGMGLRQGGATGLALGALAVSLMHRGATGHCELYHALGVNTTDDAHTAGAALNGQKGIKVEKSVTIMRPAGELYTFWRNFSNLPRFMKHLESVTVDNKRSHWVAKAPAGTTVEWDAEIINEREGALIAWRSLPGSEIHNAGSVRFDQAPGNRGTVVKVSLIYDPPAGKFGVMIAKLFGEEPAIQIHEDLRRFRQLMETGEISTIEGQVSGRGYDR